MIERRGKTATDLHWNERARTLADATRVNIDDLAQRSLENAFLLEYIGSADRVLEVGCGNGYLTRELRERAAYVDAFDFAENMIAAAKEDVGEKNNRFFVHSVLDRDGINETYDCIVCVRVLINLADTAEQCLALENMASWLKSGGKLILVEGFRDGFERLNVLRQECGLATLEPAPINHYSPLAEIKPVLEKNFAVIESWHSGMYDVLTRVLYPLLVGADKATGPAEFHEKILPLCTALNPDEFKPYARLRGNVLLKT